MKGLVFDCDGTIADTMPLHYEAWVEALGEHGVEFPEALFYELAGIPTDADHRDPERTARARHAGAGDGRLQGRTVRQADPAGAADRAGRRADRAVRGPIADGGRDRRHAGDLHEDAGGAGLAASTSSAS